VVDAVEGLVQLHGYNGFSCDDVARLVGIKKPRIHHHSPKKAERVPLRGSLCIRKLRLPRLTKLEERSP
jgi:hypothetical protein